MCPPLRLSLGFLGVKMEVPGRVRAWGVARPLTDLLVLPGRAAPSCGVTWFVVTGVVAVGAVGVMAVTLAAGAIPRWRGG